GAIFVGSAAIVRARAQNRHDPFFDYGDRGETIHVLPTPAAIHNPRDMQPTDAPVVNGTAVFPASYGSGNLTDHGGPEISSASFRAIYWSPSVANSTATSLSYPNIQSQIDGFVNAFGNSPNYGTANTASTSDYTIIQQYGSSNGISNLLANAGSRVDTQVPR